MKKTINRTFLVKTGKELVPNFDSRTFEEKSVTFFDNDPVPENVMIESVATVRASMPLDKFFEIADKKTIGVQEII